MGLQATSGCHMFFPVHLLTPPCPRFQLCCWRHHRTGTRTGWRNLEGPSPEILSAWQNSKNQKRLVDTSMDINEYQGLLSLPCTLSRRASASSTAEIRLAAKISTGRASWKYRNSCVAFRLSLTVNGWKAYRAYSIYSCLCLYFKGAETPCCNPARSTDCQKPLPAKLPPIAACACQNRKSNQGFNFKQT